MSGKNIKKERKLQRQARALYDEANAVAERRSSLRKPIETRPEIRHMSKLFGGQTTAEQVHSAALAAKGARCSICGAPPLITYRSMALYAELEREAPQYLAAIKSSNPNGPYVPTFPTTYGPMVIISAAYACKMCERRADLTAARHPSWVTVEIDRGPGADKPIVGVA